jgi:ABC-type transport system involved in multi-copper enzyme maturation permease subunit
MLFQHAFLETRWRFLIGLVLLSVSAAFVVLEYPQVMALSRNVTPDPSTTLGREIAEAMLLSNTFDGYVWSQWFEKNGAQLVALFAVIIGTGGLLSQAAATRLFTLSLPVSRQRLLGARACAGLAQVAILSLLPALVIVATSPLVGKTFPLADALAYALCAFAGSAVLFSLAFLFSSMFASVWAPVVLTLCAGPVLGALDVITGADRFSPLRMVHGEWYFRGLGLPWPMLLVSVLVASALVYAGIRHFARQDF